ncbi:MAG TPA: hypothetical protein VMD51_04165 [Mycobacterium sp.]|nr:hypothetical protein [Mycobacterium sp.]
MFDVVAKAAIWEFHVECDHCATTIDVSVVVYKPTQSAAKQALNELLVDYGWLPTVDGGFCRAHALPARRHST